MKEPTLINLPTPKLFTNVDSNDIFRGKENAFGSLACRFRLFFGLSNLRSKVAVDAILAAVILQNLFWCKTRESYTHDFVDELDEGQVIHERHWRQNNAHTNIAIAHTQT